MSVYTGTLESWLHFVRIHLSTNAGGVCVWHDGKEHQGILLCTDYVASWSAFWVHKCVQFDLCSPSVCVCEIFQEKVKKQSDAQILLKMKCCLSNWSKKFWASETGTLHFISQLRWRVYQSGFHQRDRTRERERDRDLFISRNCLMRWGGLIGQSSKLVRQAYRLETLGQELTQQISHRISSSGTPRFCS